jgi:hypothetical protein
MYPQAAEALVEMVVTHITQEVALEVQQLAVVVVVVVPVRLAEKLQEDIKPLHPVGLTR